MLYHIAATLPFLVCVFWTVIYLLDWPTTNAARHVMCVFLALSALLYFTHMVFFIGADGWVCVVSNTVYSFCNLSVFPMFYLYICRLTSSDPWSRRAIWFFVPALVITPITALIYCLASHSECLLVLRLDVVKVLFVAIVLLTFYFGYKRLKAFDLRLKDFYSDNEGHTLRPTEWIMTLLFIGCLMAVVSNVIGRHYFIDHPDLLFIPSAMFSCLLFAVGYIGTKQTFSIDNVLSDIPGALDDNSRTSIPTDSASELASYVPVLEALMDEQRLYLKPELRLTDLSEPMGLGRSRLSSLFNQVLGISFSDYINRRRVLHAQGILSSGPATPLQSMAVIAEMSGFTSESSFYRAFRKVTGTTPRKWRSEK